MAGARPRRRARTRSRAARVRSWPVDRTTRTPATRGHPGASPPGALRRAGPAEVVVLVHDRIPSSTANPNWRPAIPRGPFRRERPGIGWMGARSPMSRILALRRRQGIHARGRRREPPAAKKADRRTATQQEAARVGSPKETRPHGSGRDIRQLREQAPVPLPISVLPSFGGSHDGRMSPVRVKT
jgi:hypothetical protein